MATHTIYTRLSRPELRRTLATLPAIMSGRAPDRQGIAHGFKMRIAMVFWSLVKLAFLAKSQGGTDEAGITWKKLSPQYLAYGRRFARGEQAALKKAAGLGSQNRYAPGGRLKTTVHPGHAIFETTVQNKGLLTKAQLERWWSIYRKNLPWLAAKHPIGMAKGKAAAIAWATLKREGAKTKLDVYGNRQVDIGRDVGTLFNSISPGTLDESGVAASYSPPDNQYVEDHPGELVLGTNVPYAGGFHKLRPMWPEQIPAAWLDEMVEQGVEGVAKAVVLLAEGRAA